MNAARRFAYLRNLTGKSIAVLALGFGVGELYGDRPGVGYVVAPLDVALSDFDLIPLVGLDVIVIGGDLRLDSDVLAFLRRVLGAGAASVWAEFDDGVWRVEPLDRGVVAVERVEHVDEALDRIPAHRMAGLLKGSGIYRGPEYREARFAAFGVVLGPAVAEKLRRRVSA